MRPAINMILQVAAACGGGLTMLFSCLHHVPCSQHSWAPAALVTACDAQPAWQTGRSVPPVYGAALVVVA